MRYRTSARWGLTVSTAIALVIVSACHQNQPPEPAAIPANPAASGGAARPTPDAPLKNEIPSGELAAVMDAHFQGLGSMERYEYRNAIGSFREIQKRAPGWIPGSINLAIALLNDSGEKAEKAKKTGAASNGDNFDEALTLLAGVLEREPDNAHAHFCRGMILEQQGRLADAHRHFLRVTELDPGDAAAWYWTAQTLPESGRGSTKPDLAKKQIIERSKKQLELYSKALELDPYLAAGHLRHGHGRALCVAAGAVQGDVRAVSEVKSRSPGRIAGAGRNAGKKLWVHGQVCRGAQSVCGVEAGRA